MPDFMSYARSPERDRQIELARTKAKTARRRIDECIERRTRLGEMVATIDGLRAMLYESAPTQPNKCNTAAAQSARSEDT